MIRLSGLWWIHTNSICFVFFLKVIEILDLEGVKDSHIGDEVW